MSINVLGGLSLNLHQFGVCEVSGHIILDRDRLSRHRRRVVFYLHLDCQCET